MDASIQERQGDEKQQLLEQLRKTPIVQVACERVKIGRTTYYRWRKEDAEFKKASDDALSEGESFITDLSESQLLALIKEKNFPAIQLWLKTHHPKYGNRLEVVATVRNDDAPLTKAQEKLIEEALGISSAKGC